MYTIQWPPFKYLKRLMLKLYIKKWSFLFSECSCAKSSLLQTRVPSRYAMFLSPLLTYWAVHSIGRILVEVKLKSTSWRIPHFSPISSSTLYQCVCYFATFKCLCHINQTSAWLCFPWNIMRNASRIVLNLSPLFPGLQIILQQTPKYCKFISVSIFLEISLLFKWLVCFLPKGWEIWPKIYITTLLL